MFTQKKSPCLLPKQLVQSSLQIILLHQNNYSLQCCAENICSNKYMPRLFFFYNLCTICYNPCFTDRYTTGYNFAIYIAGIHCNHIHIMLTHHISSRWYNLNIVSPVTFPLYYKRIYKLTTQFFATEYYSRDVCMTASLREVIT